MVGSLLDAQATHHPRSERNSASKAEEEEEEGSLPIFTEVKEVEETMQTKRPFLCRGVLSAAVLSLPCNSNGLTVEGGRDVREAKGWWQEILKLEGGETRPPHHPFVRSFARAMDMALACLTYLRRCCFYLHTNTLKWVRPTVVVSGLWKKYGKIVRKTRAERTNGGTGNLITNNPLLVRPTPSKRSTRTKRTVEDEDRFGSVVEEEGRRRKKAN